MGSGNGLGCIGRRSGGLKPLGLDDRILRFTSEFTEPLLYSPQLILEILLVLFQELDFLSLGQVSPPIRAAAVSIFHRSFTSSIEIV